MFKIAQKKFLLTGVANKKSIAFNVAKLLQEANADVDFIVQSQEIKEKLLGIFPKSNFYVCDVENPAQIEKLRVDLLESVTRDGFKYSGFLHSIAFANYSEGMKPFHETKLNDYLQAVTISSYSLISLTQSLLPVLDTESAIVTMSISNTRATNYGYMGPIKASLDASVAFLAKSLSECSKIRVNAVCAGPVKTAASAGIPGFIDGYLFTEQLTIRHEALKTEEVAQTVRFLLSPLSSGINASAIIVDAGMSANYFDQKVVDSFIKNL